LAKPAFSNLVSFAAWAWWSGRTTFRSALTSPVSRFLMVTPLYAEGAS
jgi:hypothetical protein